MKRLLIYYNFIVISLLVVVGFVSAQSYLQLASAILFFPMFIYFALRVIPRKSKVINTSPILEISEATSIKEVQKEYGDVVKLKKEGVDIDRRQFLKLIGTAGLSLFIFSMFTKKAEAAFFGSVPGPGTVSIKDSVGNKIDPAEKQPTDGYRISEIDDSVITYLGFTNKDGAWFIMKEDTDTGNFRYVKGPSAFSVSWAVRDTLVYGYYNDVF